jgi:hypothetical protein
MATEFQSQIVFNYKKGLDYQDGACYLVVTSGWFGIFFFCD